MGLFDWVNHEMNCPVCGEWIDEFQTKEKEGCMELLNFWDVDYFYKLCSKCGTFIEFNLALGRQSFIEAYQRTTTNPENNEVKTKMSKKERKDLELASDPRFIRAMKKILKGIEKSKLDITKVKKVNLLRELLEEDAKPKEGVHNKITTGKKRI